MSLKNAPPLRKYYYVAFKETYEELPDGKVKVTDKDGQWGIFHWNGPWIEGELTDCNLHMLVWTGGPSIPKECNYRWPEVPADINRASGWPAHREKTLAHQLG